MQSLQDRDWLEGLQGPKDRLLGPRYLNSCCNGNHGHSYPARDNKFIPNHPLELQVGSNGPSWLCWPVGHPWVTLAPCTASRPRSHGGLLLKLLLGLLSFDLATCPSVAPCGSTDAGEKVLIFSQYVGDSAWVQGKVADIVIQKSSSYSWELHPNFGYKTCTESKLCEPDPEFDSISVDVAGIVQQHCALGGGQGGGEEEKAE